MTRPFTFGCLAMTPVHRVAEWREQARAAEERGFATLQVSDHFARTPLAPLLALCAAAQATSTIRLGTLVLANDFRRPSMLAKEVATCDLLCDGRLELGLGAGWLAEDYETGGIAFDPPAQRITRLAETVRILKQVFAAQEPVDVQGANYAVHNFASVPRVVQQPGPPLLLGGGGPRMLTLAARQADIVGVNMINAEGVSGSASAASAYEDATDTKIELIRRVSQERGVDVVLHLIAYWSEITEHPEQAIERKIKQVGIPVSAEQLARSPHCLIGPLGYVQDKVEALRERWGFSYITLYERDSANCAPLVEAMAGR